MQDVILDSVCRNFPTVLSRILSPRADPCSHPIPFLLAVLLRALITQQYFSSAEQREVTVSALVPELSSVGLEKRKPCRTLLGDIAPKARREGLRSEDCACFLLRWKGKVPEQIQPSSREQTVGSLESLSIVPKSGERKPAGC